jgi:GAF domain-containing protein
VGSWSADGISAPPVGASVPGDEAAAFDLPGTVTAPVRVRGRLWGALAAAGPRLGPPAPEAEDRLARLADLLALAISEGEAAEALRVSERRFRALCALSPAGVFETDAEGARTWTSDAWSER